MVTAFREKRPPQFTGQEVGIWGSSWPASLVARERLPVNAVDLVNSEALFWIRDDVSDNRNDRINAFDLH